MAIMSYRIFEYVYLNVRANLRAVGESEIMNETHILVTEYLPVSATLHFCHKSYYHDDFEQNLYRACDTNLSIPLFSEELFLHHQRPNGQPTSRIARSEATYQSFAKLQRNMEDHCFHQP